MITGFGGYFDAAQHARQLLHPIVLRQLRQRRARSAPIRELRDAHMVMALRGNRREVRYAQYLAALAESPQLAADNLRNGAADAGVHFIEHHAARVTRSARD